MKIKILAAAFCLLISLSGFTSGTFDLKGELRSFSPTTVEISDGHHIYSLLKSGLSEAQQRDLKKFKIKTMVAWKVSFQAVKDVKKM